MYTNGSACSLSTTALREQGMYGNMVANQNYVATTGHIYELDEVEFERLNGPVPPPYWVDTEDIADCSEIEDFELSQSDIWRMRHMEDVQEEVFPHEVGKAVYFEFVDKMRKKVLGAYDMDTLYALVDECLEMDMFMVNRVDNWKPVKSTFERLEAQFTKVENRLQESAAHRAHLIKVGIIKPKEVPVAV